MADRLHVALCIGRVLLPVLLSVLDGADAFHAVDVDNGRFCVFSPDECLKVADVHGSPVISVPLANAALLDLCHESLVVCGRDRLLRVDPHDVE